MYFVYVLYSQKFDKKYVGMTADLEKRLAEHNAGFTKSTKPFVPWKVIYLEKFSFRSEARNREKYFKSASGRRYLKKYVIINLAS